MMPRKRLTLEKMKTALEAARQAGVPISHIEITADGMTIHSGPPEQNAEDAQDKRKYHETLQRLHERTGEADIEAREKSENEKMLQRLRERNPEAEREAHEKKEIMRRRFNAYANGTRK